MTRQTSGDRWYRRMLRLYPKDFREEFGVEMARLHRDRAQDESRWSLARSLLVDLFRTAPAEHLRVLREDIHLAFRSLRRTPVITAAAILTLALGVGASTAVFSVVHAVLLRPLPYPQPDELVELFEDNRATGAQFRASALNYLSWAERAQRFEAIGAFRGQGATMTGAGDPEPLSGVIVTSGYFRALAVPAIVGRPLQPEDDSRAGGGVVVISESLWRDRFGADRQIVGRPIVLDGVRHEIVGVVPRAVREVGRTQMTGAAGAQIFLPMRIDRSVENRGNHTLRVIGRLRRGVPIEQARDEMRAIAAAMEDEFPATNRNWSVGMERISTTMLDPQVKRSLLVALAAVMIVFLIAGVNVANLMLVRGTRRRAELALRTTLGARRVRLVRQLLTESICLSVVSGGAGVFAAWMAHPVVVSLLPPAWPRLDEMRLDLTVLAFGVLVSTTSGIVFGVTPALRASRVDLSRALMLLGRSSAGASRVWSRHFLITAQVALATMLLVIAALLLQGFVRLQHAPIGLDPTGVWTTRVSLPSSRYAENAQAGRFYARVREAVQASPQMEAFAIGTSAPFAPGIRASFQIPGRTESASSAAPSEGAVEHIVSGGYFRVLGIPIVAGRAFSELDRIGSPPVAIVSERMARHVWPGANPLGQFLARNGQRHEVIGVVGDVRGSDGEGARGGGPDRAPRAAAYFSADQMPQRNMTLLARPRGNASGVAAIIRDAVRQEDPALPVQAMRPLHEWLEESVAPSLLTTKLAAFFAVSALLLAAVGIYGTLAYSVASRTREIGVRMAVGASRRDIIGLVLRQGMGWTVAGIVLGLTGAVAAGRLIATLLFETRAQDPVTFAAGSGAMAIVALLACSIPAARAVRVDPTAAMRAE